MKRTGTIALFLLVLAAVTASAQTLERGEVRGTVYDPQGLVVPTAKITISNAATGFQRTVESGDSGLYVFAQLPPGEYQIVAEHTGFATITIKSVQVNVGSVLTLDIKMPLAGAAQVVEVTELVGTVDTATAGIGQILNAQSVANLPLSGRDYRDLAQLSPSAQVVPGLRGFIRLGGQQSDYQGLAIDGGDAYDNFFGEAFGSLETKNFTVPLDAVQEFQVVVNGFAPEFGRATGGVINVVTKSGTNDVHGSAHYFYRGARLTADDALGTPPNIDNQHQFGGSVGFPIQEDKQFLFLSADTQRQSGPLVTKFGRDVSGVAVPESPYNISDLSSLEVANTQKQNLFSVLGRYDLRVGSRHNLSARSFFTRNRTIGFTGGRGQNEIQAAFENTEQFINQGVHTTVGFNSSWGRALNEIRGTVSWQERPRQPIGTNPETQINDTGNFGQRFFLPIDGDAYKYEVQDNFQYVFGRHEMKFGGGVNVYENRNNVFAGWSRGTFLFATLEDFGATPADQANNQNNCGASRCPFGFIQGFGLRGEDVFEAGALDIFYQTGIGLYWQDKWQATDRLTFTYGLRWDATINPTTQSATPGNEVYVGVGAPGSGSRLVLPPQNIPHDRSQFGPRVGAAYSFGNTRPTIFRASWGLYYAQTPPIFFPIGGNTRGTTLFCFFPACLPQNASPSIPYPGLYPSSLQANDPLFQFFGPPGITYVDPDFRNPRVSNFNVTVEHQFARDWTATASYVFVHSWRLRTGGFSSTQWERNVVVDHFDQFGRAILVPDPIFGPLREDPTIGSAQALASFSRGNFHQVVLGVNKRFAQRYQFFANYTWGKNEDNAASERDTDTLFGQQDPFNIELDYGRNGLDISHQFKSAIVVELPFDFTISSLAIYRSGLAYPAYISDLIDINGDGVNNQGVGSNDRPTVGSGSGAFLLPRYPARQPDFFQLDLRLNKAFKFTDRYRLEGLVEFFNLFNRDNLYSNPNIAAKVDPVLTAIPRPGDVFSASTIPYRTLNQISPGSTPFAVQFGVRFFF